MIRLPEPYEDAALRARYNAFMTARHRIDPPRRGRSIRRETLIASGIVAALALGALSFIFVTERKP